MKQPRPRGAADTAAWARLSRVDEFAPGVTQPGKHLPNKTKASPLPCFCQLFEVQLDFVRLHNYRCLHVTVGGAHVTQSLTKYG